MSPFALSAHMYPLAVGEHGAPRLPVSGVHQGAAIVLPAIVNEGNDTCGPTGSARDSCAFLGKEEREYSGAFFLLVKYRTLMVN